MPQTRDHLASVCLRPYQPKGKTQRHVHLTPQPNQFMNQTVVGASLSEPQTSVIAFAEVCVCLRPYTVNFKECHYVPRSRCAPPCVLTLCSTAHAAYMSMVQVRPCIACVLNTEVL